MKDYEEKLNQPISKEDLLKFGISDKSCDVLIDRCGGLLSWLSFDVHNEDKHIRLISRGVTTDEINILKNNITDNVLEGTHSRKCISTKLRLKNE